MPTEVREVQGSLLFTPADRPDRFARGEVASRGRLILDLEDAVAPEAKPAGRSAVAGWFSAGNRSFVRINAPSSPFFAEDVEALGRLPVTKIIVPKAESAEQVRQVRSVWRDARIYPLIESALGLRHIDEIAKSAGVNQLVFGALDLHADLSVTFPSTALMQHARMTIAIASRAAGIAPPIDTPHPAVTDAEAVERDTKDAAACGFVGKLCIHPAQIAVVDQAFAPSPQDLAWAREVVEAAANLGVVKVRGRMVDAPVVLSAQRMLAYAKALAG